MRYLIAALLCVLCLDTSARCRANDSWHGEDKQMHAMAGGGIAFIATLQTGDPWKGFMYGAGAGLAKEAIDATGLGDCSLQDLAVTAIAAGVAAYTGGLFITHAQGRTMVAYAKTF